MGFLPGRDEVVISSIIERTAAERPDACCVSFEDGTAWTWAQARDEMYRAAGALRGLGVERGDHVVIVLPNGPDWLRAWWGTVAAGAVMAPLNPALKGEMLRHGVTDARAAIAVSAGEPAERIGELGTGVTVVDPARLTQGADKPPGLEPPIEPWDVHTINYTSGTTGPAKGVITTFMHSYAAALYNDWRATPDDVLLVTSPLFHAGGQVPAMGAWIGGAQVALRSAFSGTGFLDVVRETGATITLLVGTMGHFLDATPEKPDDADNPLRVAMIVPMVPDPDAFMRRFGLEEVLAAFGMTECGTGMVVRGPKVEKPGTAGKARPGLEIRLVDEHDVPVPVGEPGELTMRTERPWEISPGYLNRPEETVAAWRNGWFHTGDMFRVDEDGDYFFVDRLKDSLRRRGENISSFEVEREVAAHPDVAEVACVAAPGEYGDDEVKVFVVPREGADLDPARLVEFLIPRMAYFMVPRFVEVVDELPKTPTLRVRKFELRARGNSEHTWDREEAGIEVRRDV